MKPGHVYERFTLPDGRRLVLRALSSSDLAQAVRFANALVREGRTNRELGVLLDTPVTRKEEREWLARVVSGIRRENTFSVAAFHDGSLVGNCDIWRQRFKDLRHSGTLGIAILDGYRGLGLGRKMLQHLLKASAGGGLTLAELRVLSINRRAIRLYASLGFKEAGRVPGKIIRNGRRIDEILMFRQS